MKKEEPKQPAPKQFQAPRGVHDVLPQDEAYWDKLETTVRGLAKSFNFTRLDPPILEFAELYNKTTGEESDIVEKEIYTLKTKGGDVLALRPEFTPGMARAYMEHGLSRMGQPQKLYTIGPVFRHDRPQLGRYRQFTQMDFEVLGGVSDPIYDAEIISIAVEIVRAAKIRDFSLKVNSIGCRICRPIYKKQLTNYYKNHERELCETCQRRLKTNPLRLLDCKEEECIRLREKAPNILDKLCSLCSTHFRGVLEYLDEVAIPYELDHRLVRGLDYYSRTVFEIFAAGKEADIGAIAAGGRYDYLMETIGGHLTPAIGFAAGLERIIAVMKAREGGASGNGSGNLGNGSEHDTAHTHGRSKERRVFVAHAGELAKKKAFALLAHLRGEGVAVSEALAKESLGAQLKSADKEGLHIALILGQKEIYENTVIVRDLVSGAQEAVPMEKLVAEVKRRFK